jgi:hypothetical protein
MNPITERMKHMQDWFKESKAHELLEGQKHLDNGTVEQAYWHYGYLQALKDVQNYITPKGTKQ